MRKKILVLGVALVGALCGCVSTRMPDGIRVGSYNIRLSSGDKGTPNDWELRKADLVALVKDLDLDVFGMQEVRPDQAAYLRESLPDFAFVGDHRGADRKSDEASPVFYRKSRFEVEKSGTFWLSETPEVPASKSWETACPRVCSYLVLRDGLTGKRLCFANTHTDHRSERARTEGMKLILARMAEFSQGAPIVFTGDHNCPYESVPAASVREVLKDGRDIAERLSGSRITFQGFGTRNPGSCIDYIYVSDGVRVLDFATHGDKRPGTDLYPSDHFPVTATVVLP